jgi:hypothetical protein
LNLKVHFKIEALTKVFNSLSPITIRGYPEIGQWWIYNAFDIKEELSIMYGRLWTWKRN